MLSCLVTLTQQTCTTSSTYTHSLHGIHSHLLSHGPTHQRALLHIHPRLPTQTPTYTHTCPSSHTSPPSLSQTSSQTQHTLPHVYSHHCLTCARAHTHTESLPHTITFLPLSLTNIPSAKSVALLQSRPNSICCCSLPCPWPSWPQSLPFHLQCCRLWLCHLRLVNTYMWNIHVFIQQILIEY